ncbi:NAD-dependent epimerase/dehydratase family protein [Labrys monachus]|uniref:UDP-glucuronate 4-epimerase n=1 Tax=Labrys monachus TaxID=217067 RepID=A0ABU0FPB6_9HYPH|nr:NAD-dependent epimerase/dehydratase family protein [Labrys monachus]MDQ0396454.1 UDP-glucuronate 4-epimerase [Labrys monachus]
MKIWITGSAGFIGFHLAGRLLGEGHLVTGIDGLTPYYDPGLKRARHALLERSNAFRPHIFMLEDREALGRLAAEDPPEVIIHLAGQAGVRYSLENPRAYVDSNLVGLFNLMEVAREAQVRHFLFASTSSIYGANASIPFRETDRADQPLTLYAATKKSGEGMLHSYAHLWSMPVTCFRFFTVYGPWGRPDMATFKFVDAIEEGRPIEIYGEGRMERDFTFIDDLVEAIVRLVPQVPRIGEPAGPAGLDSLSPVAPHRVVNIAAGRPVGLLDFVEAIETAMGRKAIRRMLPMQQGDVPRTFASAELLEALTGYRPSTELAQGIRAFVQWYRAWKMSAV